jgi:hypothetical protein
MLVGFSSIALAGSVWPSVAKAQGSGPLGATTVGMQAADTSPAAASPAGPSAAVAAPDAPLAGDTSAPPPGMVSASPTPTRELGVDEVSSNERPTRSNKGRISGFVGWAFNVPLGSVRDFTAVVSPLGFEFQLNGWVTSNITVGVSGDWATYTDDRPRTTYAVNNTAVTATAYNYVQTTGAHFLAHYYFLEEGPVLPYVGPHVGVSWTAFDSEEADFDLSDLEVSMVFGAEVGAEIPFGRNAPVALANLRYSVSPAADFLGVVDDVQSLGLLVGLGF